MVSFRQVIREQTASAHKKLENHKQMVAYSSGDATSRDYQAVLQCLCDFWQSSAPATRTLPVPYHELLASYRAALCCDLAALPAEPEEEKRRFHEIGYFYVLIGSSHGARYMLKNGRGDLPRQHLLVLAERGSALWPSFVKDHLSAVPADEADAVLSSAQDMFETLYQCVNNET